MERNTSSLLLNFRGTGTLAEVLQSFMFESGLVSDKGSVFQRDTKSSCDLCFSETTIQWNKPPNLRCSRVISEES